MPNSKGFGFKVANPSFLQLETIIFNSNQERKLGTCQGRKFLYLGQLELTFSNVWSPHELLHGRPKTTRLGWKRINTNNYNFGCNGFRRWMFSWKQLVFFTLNYIYKLPLFDILRISYHPTYFFSNEGPLAMYPACCPHRASQTLKAWNSIAVGELWLDFYFYLHWVLVWDRRPEIKFGDFKLGWFNNQSIGECVFIPTPLVGPGLDHIFIQLGPVPLTSPSLLRSSCLHLCGYSSLLGTNVTISCRLSH